MPASVFDKTCGDGTRLTPAVAGPYIAALPAINAIVIILAQEPISYVFVGIQ